MMRRYFTAISVALAAVAIAWQSADAATILKLDLGGTGPDLNYSGGVFGALATTNDGNAGTTGDQNTAILYTGFLSSTPASTGSYTLSGTAAVGFPTPLGGGVFSQNFSGGNFKLYDNSNAVLLDVNLGSSLLVGGGNGAFFNITNGTVVTGSLASQVIGNSIGMSMALSNISGGGLSLDPGTGRLNPFFADSSKDITADAVPEPAAAGLLLFGVAAAFVARRGGR